MNLTIDTADANNHYLGLFGQINSSAAQVKNLGIDNAIIIGGSGSGYLGGLCGDNYQGTISNCYVTGQVAGGGNLGGLCGRIYHGTISNCYATGQVTGTAPTGSSNIGVLCGENYYGTINNSYAAGQVVIVGNFSRWLGGLCGENYAGTISGCFATGQVTSGIYSQDIGGLCGYNVTNSSISNCYSTVQVTCGPGSTAVGGLCGWNRSSTISNCYSTGLVTVYGPINSGGGFCGANLDGSFTACFWDVNTSGQTTSAGGTGKTTVQMQTQSTFTDAGWDFVWETVNGPNDIWAICEGVSYPKLAWQYVVGDSDIDLDVDFIDFALMGEKWREADETLYCGGTDLTGDGWVDWDDLDALVENWLLGP